MNTIPGVVVGKVKDVNDPNGEGRIRVVFPWMGGSNESYWAPVVTFMSGNGRGSWFMPEVGDEVLVAFDHGDINHPFVLGFLWNGQDKPPETDTHKRLLKTVSGHSILLDDSDGSTKIEITTSGGLKVTMDDSSKTITIDSNDAITIKASQQVTVNAPNVSVEAQQVKLGQNAAHKSVHGDELLQYLDTLVSIFTAHMHVGEMAAGILPVVPQPPLPAPPLLPPSPTMLSLVVQEA